MRAVIEMLPYQKRSVNTFDRLQVLHLERERGERERECVCVRERERERERERDRVIKDSLS